MPIRPDAHPCRPGGPSGSQSAGQGAAASGLGRPQDAAARPAGTAEPEGGGRRDGLAAVARRLLEAGGGDAGGDDAGSDERDGGKRDGGKRDGGQRDGDGRGGAEGPSDDGGERAEGPRTVRLGALLDEVAGRAFGPLLLVPALLAILPVIGAIPGMSVLTAGLLALIAGQALLGRRQPWMPARLRRLPVRRRPLAEGVTRAEPWLRRIDRVLRPRLTWMTRGPGLLAAMLCVLAMAGLMVPLAVVPFGVMAPGTAVFLVALGVTAEDGAWTLAGCLAALAAALASLRLLGWL